MARLPGETHIPVTVLELQQIKAWAISTRRSIRNERATLGTARVNTMVKRTSQIIVCVDKLLDVDLFDRLKGR